MDYLYGKLNNEVKNIEYKGKETDTALVSVDSKENTISVDVLKVPNKLSVGTFLGKTIYYDGGSPIYINLRSEVDDTPKDGSYKVVTSGGVKEYVDTSLENLSDKKLDKSTTPKIVYSTDSLGNQIVIKYDDSQSDGTIVKRTSNGTIKSNDPLEESDVVTKKYADDIRENIQQKLDTKFDKNGGTIDGDVSVKGNLNVDGEISVIDTQHLSVKDAVIITNSDGSPLVGLSGLAINTGENGEEDASSYGIMYDNSDKSVKLGVVEKQESGDWVFSDGEGLPITIRDNDTNMADSMFVKWDSENRCIVTGSTEDGTAFNENSFLPRINNDTTVATAYVISKDNTYTLYRISQSANANTLAMRNQQGRIKASNPKDTDDVVNVGYANDNYVSKNKESDEYYRVYSVDKDGNDTVIRASDKYASGAIAKYSETSQLSTNEPTDDDHAVNLKYANDNYIRSTAQSSGDYGKIYSSNVDDGTIKMMEYSTAPTPWAIPQYNADGILQSENPSLETDVTNKKYVDDGFVHKGITPKAVYTRDSEGTESMIAYNENASAWTIVQRADDGVVKAGTPLSAEDATTKEYVDSALKKKLDTYTGTAWYPVIPTQRRISVSDPSVGYYQDWEQMSSDAIGSTVAKRTTNGTLATGTPTSDSDATPKKYVEDNFVAKVSDNAIVYGTSASDGSTKAIPWNTASVPNTIVMRDANGRSMISSPAESTHIANKGYVDDNFVAKKTTDSGDYVYGYNSSGDSTYKVSANADLNTIVLRDDDTGGIKVGTINCNGMIISNFQILGEDCNATFYSASIQRLGVDTYVRLSGEITVTEGSNIVNATAPTDDSHLTNKKYVDAFQTITILGADD